MTSPQVSGSILSPCRATRAESIDGLFWITAIFVAVAFFAAEHNLFITRPLGSVLDESGVLERGGPADFENAQLRFGFLGFGALGCALLLSPARRPLRRPGALVWLMAAYGTISVGSIIWSDSPQSTAQQLLPLVCFGAGVLGLARQFTVRELTKLVFVVMALYVVIGVTAEVVLGTFNPQSGIYRFAGTLPSDMQGIHCALLALSALALLRHTRRNLPLHLGFIALGVLFLLLTRSPTSCCAFLAAVMVELFLQHRSDRKWLNWAWAPGLALALMAADTIVNRTGGEVAERISVMGRGSETQTLAGEVALWTDQVKYLAENPLLGHGYGADWISRRATDISLRQGGLNTRMHSGVVEVLSNVGIVGAAVCFLVAILGLCQAWRRYQWTEEEGYRFLVAQIVLGLVNSLVNAQYAVPSLCAAACAASLASLAMTPKEAGEATSSPVSQQPATSTRLVRLEAGLS